VTKIYIQKEVREEEGCGVGDPPCTNTIIKKRRKKIGC
jgi:hypothetical protein